MSVKTKKLTTCAVLTAFSVAALYAASIMPTGQLGFSAIASLFCIAAVIETGLKGGLSVYICSTVLGLLLLPNKAIMVLYGLFLGYYPIIKSLAEKCRSRVVEWIIKIAVMDVALTVIVLLFRAVIFNAQSFTDSIFIVYIAGNIAYIIFDIGVSKAIWFYIDRISKKIGRN